MKNEEKRFLIDEWFPSDAIGIENLRGNNAARKAAPNRLHVWFARRPLPISRAAVLLSLLSPSVDKKQVLKILGIPPDVNMNKIIEKLERVRATGESMGKVFHWPLAQNHVPTREELQLISSWNTQVWGIPAPTVVDPMAGGGSIPYEAVRLGLPTVAGELNPVAYVILRATVEYPARFGARLVPAMREFCTRVHQAASREVKSFFPKGEGERVYAYLWARTVRCPNCGLRIPMSPNWWVVRGGERSSEVAVRLIVPEEGAGDECSFEVVKNPQPAGLEPYKGTDVEKEALCPRCGRVMAGDAVKAEAQAGRMGHQLYAVCTKIKRAGGKRSVWNFRVPTADDYEAVVHAEERLREKLPEWEKHGLVPNERIPLGLKTREPLNFGLTRWCDLFNSRQLLTHLTYLEKFLEEKRRLLEEAGEGTEKHVFAEAVATYGAIVFDTCVDYNCLLSLWHPGRSIVAHMMGLQAFPFKSSYAEFDHSQMLWPWALSKTLDSIEELVKLLPNQPGEVKIYCGDSASISLEPKSVESIIVDPPYHENVMYAEVSDFFYVWLKRTVGDLFPDAFRGELTEKQEEAVANPAMFHDLARGQAGKLATQHYLSKMEACFREMKRVLRDDGVLTVMFTHRKAEAWASLATALINAGFTFRASWPVFTEPGQKFGKAEKGVLKVTVLLACRKRLEDRRGLWEEVVHELYEEAERKVKEHAAKGITGPDLLVSVYGPVLGKFANYSLVKDALGKVRTPADALVIVAEVVNKFTTADIPEADSDTLAYINLIRNFPGLQAEYDLARLTTVFGGNITLDTLDVKGGKGLVEKKAGKVNILTAQQRLEKGFINPNKPEALRSLIDVAHASVIAYERRGLGAVKELLRQTARDTAESGYIATLRAIAQIGVNTVARPLANEAKTISILLESMGHQPEATRRRGESIDDYVRP